MIAILYGNYIIWKLNNGNRQTVTFILDFNNTNVLVTSALFKVVISTTKHFLFKLIKTEEEEFNQWSFMGERQRVISAPLLNRAYM